MRRTAPFVLLALACAACDAPLPRAAEAAPPPASPPPAAAPAWSAPAPAAELSRALGPRGQHASASAAFDARGVLHVAFSVDRDRDGWGDAVLHATWNGRSWSAPEDVGAAAPLAESPRLAVDAAGRVHLLWYAHSGPSQPEQATELVHATLDGGRWSAPRVVYREAARGGIPDLSLAVRPAADGVQALFEASGRGIGVVQLDAGGSGVPRWLDDDGMQMSFATAADGARGEFAYVGEVPTPAQPRTDNDVYVRTADGAFHQAYRMLGRYSHYPRLVVDGRGRRHLFWLEDTHGDVTPEALFYATSADGVRWTAPRDLTPAGLGGGVVFSVAAAVDARDRIHLLLRGADRGGAREGLYALSLSGGAPSAALALAPPGAAMPGDAQLLHDRARHRILALWRGGDGVYRTATLAE